MDADSLEQILRDRGFDLDRSDLEAALSFQPAGGEDLPLSEWAQLHLHPDTLLTTDELATFSALSAAGLPDHLTASYDITLHPPRSQPELHRAVQELRRSTAAISKQTETLRQQQEALARFARARLEGEGLRSEVEDQRMHFVAVQTRTAKADVDELSRALEIKLSELEQQSHHADSDLQQGVGALLASDDKLLTSLQKLNGEFSLAGSGEEDVVEGLRQTCMKLIKCTVEMTRCKLDRTYLEALSASTSSLSGAQDDDTASVEDVRAVQDELDSLYAEILPVVQMSVENQYLHPATRRVTSKNARALDHSSSAVEYMNDCLDHLADRIEALSTRIKTLHSHRAASAILAATASSELATHPSKPRRIEDDPHRTPAPTRRRRKSSSTDHAPIPQRTRSNTTNLVLRRRRSSTSHDEAPLDTLLRTLNVTLPDPSPSSDGRTKTSALEATLSERTAKANDVAHSAQRALESGAAQHLGDAEAAANLLWEALLADSPHGRVSLVDGEIEGSLAVLEGEVLKLRGEVDGVDPRGVRVSSGKREELLRRWGRGR